MDLGHTFSGQVWAGAHAGWCRQAVQAGRHGWESMGGQVGMGRQAQGNDFVS